MTVAEMAAVIVNRYGTTIRGRRVVDMSDQQIYAIYTSIRKREESSPKIQRTSPARCGSCGWYTENKCGKYGYKTNPTSLACGTGFTDVNENGHQITMFEQN